MLGKYLWVLLASVLQVLLLLVVVCFYIYLCLSSLPPVPSPPTHPSHLPHHSHCALRYAHIQVIQDSHFPFARSVALVGALNHHHISLCGADGAPGGGGGTAVGGGGGGRSAVKVRDDGKAVELVVRDK